MRDDVLLTGYGLAYPDSTWLEGFRINYINSSGGIHQTWIHIVRAMYLLDIHTWVCSKAPGMAIKRRICSMRTECDEHFNTQPPLPQWQFPFSSQLFKTWGACDVSSLQKQDE